MHQALAAEMSPTETAIEAETPTGRRGGVLKGPRAARMSGSAAAGIHHPKKGTLNPYKSMLTLRNRIRYYVGGGYVHVKAMSGLDESKSIHLPTKVFFSAWGMVKVASLHE